MDKAQRKKIYQIIHLLLCINIKHVTLMHVLCYVLSIIISFNLLISREGGSDYFCPFLKKRFYLFLERGGEREGEKHHIVVACHAPPTGDLAHNPGMCPDWELNQRPFGSQARSQPTRYSSQGWLFLFCREGNRGSGRLKDFPKPTAGEG